MQRRRGTIFAHPAVPDAKMVHGSLTLLP